jgi:hypothetical protein
MRHAAELLLECEWLTEGAADAREAPVGLLVLFQVNCPGCFKHALPALNCVAARRSAGQAVRALALATAFEDFELNTLENTRLLVERGETVGETLRAGINEFDLNERIGVAFDSLVPALGLNDPATVRARAEEQLAEAMASEPRLAALGASAREALLPSMEAQVRSRRWIAKTFSRLKARGTPTLLLFDNTRTTGPDGARPILRQWLGRAPDDALDRWIAEARETVAKAKGAGD